MTQDDYYRKKIQTDILRIIEMQVIDKKMSAIRAKEIAQYLVKNIYPTQQNQEIYNIIKTLNIRFPELTPVVRKAILNHIEEQKKELADKIDKLIKSGQSDLALKHIAKLSSF